MKGKFPNNEFTAQKMKFSIKDFFGKCDQIRADLVTFTQEILYGKLHFLRSDYHVIKEYTFLLNNE